MVKLCRWVVIAAALAFVVLSGVMNATFLSSLGRTYSERILLAAISVAGDLAKAALPVLIMWLWARRAWTQCAIAIIMLVVLIVVSLASGAGFSAAMRASAAARHESRSDQGKRQKSDLAVLDRQLDASLNVRAIAVVDAERSVLLLDRRWNSTKACTDITQPASLTFCAMVRSLDVERASAEERQRLVTRRDELLAQLATGASGGETGDPERQATAIAELLGVDDRLVRRAFSVGMAVVVELGCVLLLLVVGGTIWMPRIVEPEKPLPAAVSDDSARSDHLYWRWLQRIDNVSEKTQDADVKQGRGRGVRASGA